MTHDRPAPGVSRRRFLAQVGVLGAAVAVAPALRAAAAGGAIDPGAKAVLDVVRPALQALARDTIGGLVAFVVPGRDGYSQAQQQTTETPGGVEAGGIEFMMRALDNFLPMPDEWTRELAAAFATGTSDNGADGAAAVPVEVTRAFDDQLRVLLANDQAVPLSLVIALMLNWLATRVNPASVAGTFPSPFANLTYPEKIEAFRLLEEEDAALLALADSGGPEPGRRSMSGLFAFVAGALLEFAAYGSFGELGVFDAESRTLRSRPVGWDLSNYQPGRTVPVDGWDELKGYYRGAHAASDARTWPTGGN